MILIDKNQTLKGEFINTSTSKNFKKNICSDTSSFRWNLKWIEREKVVWLNLIVCCVNSSCTKWSSNFDELKCV